MERSDLRRLQSELLASVLERAAHTPFYERRFTELGLTPSHFPDLDHIQDLPFTTKDDLRAHPHQDFLAVPEDEVVRLHASSGTTGTPTAILHSRADLENWADTVARCLTMNGLGRKDVFQNMVGYGLFTGGLGLHYGVERIGATCIPAGVGNSRRQIMLMKRFGTTAIHIIPSYALKLASTMDDLDIRPGRDIHLRLAVVGAEPFSENTRRRIEAAFGVTAVNSYGLSEMNGPGVAFDCPERNGLHIWEDHFLPEVVHPETLQPLPDGEVGELVLTTLRREAMPLIRYRTRDLARILDRPCPCGRTHRMLSKVHGRSDDMIIVKGVNIFPVQVERVLMGLAETGSNYQIELDNDGEQDRMTVSVEMHPSLTKAGDAAQREAAQKIGRLLRDEILVSPVVRLIPYGGMPAGDGKAVRVVDKRADLVDA